MSWDIDASLKRALIKQGWIWGDRYYRKGNPFVWVDGPLALGPNDYSGIIDLKEIYAMYYEEYPTRKEFKYDNYEKDFALIQQTYQKIFDFYFPFLDSNDEINKLHVKCNSLASIQDYCVFKHNAKKLFSEDKVHHLDFGSGMGGAATYSLKLLNSKFTGIEAHKWSYNVQRYFYRALVEDKGKYLDLINAETMELSYDELKKLINSDRFLIKQIPSWYFPDIKKESQDLITATTCLNEINDAGIIWFLVNSNKVLKKDGYIYIRDSAKLKPDRHIVNYDEVLVKEMGYELVKWYDLVNRKDIFSIPRIYQKKKSVDLDFDEFFNHILGREAITSHGGRYNQNLKKNNLIS